MYKVFVNDKLMHDANIPDLKIFSPKLKLQQNAIDELTFSITNKHPYNAELKKMQSSINVYDDASLIFKGRLIEDGDNTLKTRKVYCESAEAFFCDSVQIPYEFTGSITEFVTLLINQHNSQVDTSKQFKVGTITVTDPNDYIVRSDTQYLTTWESIKKKLIEPLGGYVYIRHEKDGMYFDYLEEYKTLNNQAVEFGENMLSVGTSSTAKDVFTVVIPLGAKNEETGKRLTIEDVNEGKTYIEDIEGIATFGRIWKVLTWDDVTMASNLKRKAEEALSEGRTVVNSIEINALDMASVKKDISSFKMNAQIHIKSKFHGLDGYFTPEKMDISLFKPSDNKITLNSSHNALTDDNNDFGAIVEQIENIVQNYEVNIPNKITQLQKELNSIIEQTANSIRTEISEKYYSKDDKTDLVSEITTVFEQNKEYFEMQFNQFRQDLDGILSDTNANFEDIRKFIRFQDGNIILGQIGNEFQLIITKERISFMQGVQEIAYVSNSKMYNRYVQVLEVFQQGDFAMVVRENGNLSIKAVG